MAVGDRNEDDYLYALERGGFEPKTPDFCVVCNANNDEGEDHNAADHATAWGTLMDPDGNLKEQREIITWMREQEKKPESEIMANADLVAEKSDRLVDLVEALDQWITRGGFLPKEWRDARKAS
jgi:hypothetical protein